MRTSFLFLVAFFLSYPILAQDDCEELAKAIKVYDIKTIEKKLQKGISSHCNYAYTYRSPSVLFKGGWLYRDVFTEALLMANDNFDKGKPILELLIAHGANVNGSRDNHTNELPLKVAIENTNIKLCSFLIEKGVDLNDHSGITTYLDDAIKKNDVAIIQLLLENGATVSSEISTACRIGNMTVIKLMIKHGANINYLEKGNAPIFEAIDYYHFFKDKSVLQFLVDQKVDLGIKNKFDRTPLEEVIHLGYSDLAEMLGESKESSVNLSLKLHDAIKVNDVLAVKTLVDKGANAKAPKLLVSAIENENIEIIDILISKGADVNANTGFFDERVLNIACQSCNQKIIETLISNGALFSLLKDDVFEDAIDCSIEFWKYLSAEGASCDKVNLAEYNLAELSLVKLDYLRLKGADLNKKDYMGEALIYKVIDEENIELMNYLFTAKVDLNVTNKDGECLALTLMSKRKKELFLKVLKSGADKNWQNKYGKSLLHFSVIWGLPDYTKILLDAGANPNIKDNTGKTPLKEECWDKLTEQKIKAMLKSAGATE